MPRLPDRLVSRMQPTSTQGARLAASEVSSASVTEARAVATQAVDAVENREALSALKTRLGGEAVPTPLSSLTELPAGRRWLDGAARIGRDSPSADVKVLQRALMKIGAHHPQGRGQPELMLLPWGADGSLGQGTLRAVDAALRLAGRADLVPSANRQPLGREVAQAIEGLLRATPSITLPAQQDVFPTTPSTTPATNGTSGRHTVLGHVSLPVSTTPYTERWRGVLSRIASEQARYRPGAPGLSPAANHWLSEMESLRGRPDSFKLNAVNTYINGFLYASDLRDTWSTPLEFLERRGDCEDYAIAKYVSLQRLGFDESRMRLLVVRDTLTREGHAVLAVDMPDGTYLLDNQARLALKHQDVKLDDGRPRYEPLVGLSRTQQWIYGLAR